MLKKMRKEIYDMKKITRVLAICMVLLLGSLLLVACDLTATSLDETTVSDVTENTPSETKPSDGAVNQAPEATEPESAPAEENAPDENAPDEEAPDESAPADEATEENAPAESAPAEEATTENTPAETTPDEEPVVIVPMEPTEIPDDDYEDKTVAKHPSVDKKFYVLYKQLTAPTNGMIGVSLTLYTENGTELQHVEFYFENGGKDGVAKDVERIIWNTDLTLEIHMADPAATVFHMTAK